MAPDPRATRRVEKHRDRRVWTSSLGRLALQEAVGEGPATGVRGSLRALVAAALLAVPGSRIARGAFASCEAARGTGPLLCARGDIHLSQVGLDTVKPAVATSSAGSQATYACAGPRPGCSKPSASSDASSATPTSPSSPTPSSATSPVTPASTLRRRRSPLRPCEIIHQETAAEVPRRPGHPPLPDQGYLGPPPLCTPRQPSAPTAAEATEGRGAGASSGRRSRFARQPERGRRCRFARGATANRRAAHATPLRRGSRAGSFGASANLATGRARNGR